MLRPNRLRSLVEYDDPRQRQLRTLARALGVEVIHAGKMIPDRGAGLGGGLVDYAMVGAPFDDAYFVLIADSPDALAAAFASREAFVVAALAAFAPDSLERLRRCEQLKRDRLAALVREAHTAIVTTRDARNAAIDAERARLLALWHAADPAD